MKKSIKILAILFAVILLTLNISLATDIDMNLEPEQDDITTLSNETTQGNLVEETTNELTNDEYVDNAGQDSTLTTTPSTTISTLSSVPDEALSLTNILNILLIVVGVVLILLGIAILIRMHS